MPPKERQARTEGEVCECQDNAYSLPRFPLSQLLFASRRSTPRLVSQSLLHYSAALEKFEGKV